MFTFYAVRSIIVVMNSENEKQAKKISRLENRVLRLEVQKENLKQRNDKLKERLAKKDLLIKQLQDKLAKEGKISQPPVKRLYSLHPELAKSFSALCKEWNLKTMNMRNTTMAILKLIEPDDNGVVEYTEQDIVNYITVLRRIGRSAYMKNETLRHYYDPYDSLVLFKHYKLIRKNLLLMLNPEKAKSEELGFRTDYVKLDGKVITPKQPTAVCSWDDLRNQKYREGHVNDSVDIGEFKGDDLIRERERRLIQKGGKYNEEVIKERIRYQADQYWHKNELIDQVVAETPIMEEDDDDISLEELEER